MSGFVYHLVKTMDSGPIITQYIDGKYGEKFYGVELYAIENNEKYDVYCKILIGPQTGFFRYYQDVGVIGNEDNLRHVTKNFSDIKIKEIDGEKFLFIGDKNIIKMEKLERGR